MEYRAAVPDEIARMAEALPVEVRSWIDERCSPEAQSGRRGRLELWVKPVRRIPLPGNPPGTGAWRCNSCRTPSRRGFPVRSCYRTLTHTPVSVRPSGGSQSRINEILPLDLCFNMVVSVKNKYVQPVEVIDAASNNREKKKGDEVPLGHRPHSL